MLPLTRQYPRLSAYDAAYVELALREGLPFATLDDELRTVAGEAGVGVVESLKRLSGLNRYCLPSRHPFHHNGGLRSKEGVRNFSISTCLSYSRRNRMYR